MRIGFLIILFVFGTACSDGGGSPPGSDGGPDASTPIDAGGPAGLGAGCIDDVACASGHCVDGVCCDSACDGACAACGIDGVCAPAPITTVCRPAAAACDVDELCDGTGFSCPVDAFEDEGTLCRDADTNGCDLPESCTGASPSCPADLVADHGTECGHYVCSGASSTCPTACTSHADCASGAVCASGACIEAKWAFVTSTATLGSLGGLSGGDTFCQAHADSVGLPGSYRAWLADSTGSPSTRFIASGVPYVMPAGAVALVLANDYADLTDGTLQHNFSQNELGQTVTSGQAYTNVSASGTALSSASSCSSWTSASVNVGGGNGTLASTTSTWTNGGSTSCNAARRLYCFEQ